MTDRIRHLCSAFLRRLSMRPPRGHMEMLRDVVGKREDERLARDAELESKRHTSRSTESPGDDG